MNDQGDLARRITARVQRTSLAADPDFPAFAKWVSKSYRKYGREEAHDFARCFRAPHESPRVTHCRAALHSTARHLTISPRTIAC